MLQTKWKPIQHPSEFTHMIKRRIGFGDFLG